MKKQHQKKKSRKPGKQQASRKSATGGKEQSATAAVAAAPGKEAKPQPVSKPAPKKKADKKGEAGFSPARYIQVAVQFLRESQMELKKVKWPTRKELLASTAVVIVLTLLVALYLGVVDFGLIKIIRVIIG